MNNSIFICLAVCLPLLMPGRSNDPGFLQLNQSIQKPVVKATGAVQISGLGFYAIGDECNDPDGAGADYAIRMTGDLTGCLYGFIDYYDCSPSGTYREEGREYFVGTYKGETGTFWTTYKFEGRYEGCAESGAPLGAEIFGRCQHPIVGGSGEGVFDGVTGRVDFKDDVDAGNYPYRGHLRY